MGDRGIGRSGIDRPWIEARGRKRTASYPLIVVVGRTCYCLLSLRLSPTPLISEVPLCVAVVLEVIPDESVEGIQVVTR